MKSIIALILLIVLNTAAFGQALPFPGPGGIAASGGAGTTVDFEAKAEDTTDQTTYTFAAQALGAAAADRCNVVGFISRSASARTVSGVTIDGVAATAIVTANNNASGADIAAIYAAATPSADVTGDVVLTFSGAMIRAAVVVWRMVGQAACTTPTATSSSTTLVALVGTANVNVSANGDAIGICYILSGGTAAATWTAGLSSDATGSPETAANAYNGGHAHSSGTPLGITCTGDAGAARVALSTASWGP